jgi:uncharacterized protein YeaO (DUF488 family)
MNTKRMKPIKDIADNALREWLLTISQSENTQRMYRISMKQFKEFTGKTCDEMLKEREQRLTTDRVKRKTYERLPVQSRKW